LASLESGGAYALAFASGSATTATVLQSLGPNAHIVSVNDVYGGTFRYMTRVAKENQGLQTTFVDLESADEDQINSAIRDDTKVCLSFCFQSTLLTYASLAHLDRVSYKSDASLDRHTPHCCNRKITPLTTSSLGG
jgi:O-acetylhomoserine/O-acetylserine sulfhydrylase-like pyridoxal-dependent enzyme